MMRKTYIWMLSFLLASLQLHAQSAADTKLEIYQIKVSEGHATLIVTKNNAGTIIYKSVLIDAGESKDDADLIEQMIKRNDVARGRLDVVMVTHHDKDHWGGLPNTAGNTTQGLLAKRCTATGSLAAYNTNSAGILVPLKLYYSTSAQNPPTGSRIKPGDLSYLFGANLRVANWEKDLDIEMMPNVPTIDIQIKTLAVNGYRRDGTDRLANTVKGSYKNKTDLTGSSANLLHLKAEAKNNNSATAIVVWGAFSFLIQGDLEADGSKAQIAQTITAYRRNSEAERLPVRWDAGGAPYAKIKKYAASTPATYDNNHFIRKPFSKSEAKQPFNVTAYLQNKPAPRHWVANPAEWHHRLGTTINAYNESGGRIVNKYGHACVALVPHHGAFTSNHWFTTRHALIGSNHENANGHPNPQAIASLYNTTGATNFYITYLLNASGINRLNEVNDLLTKPYVRQSWEPSATGRSDYLPGAKVYYLDDGGAGPSGTRSPNLSARKGTVGKNALSYFKVTVDHNSQFSIGTELGTSNIRTMAACDGH